MSVLLDSWRLDAWQYRSLEHMLECPGLEVRLIQLRKGWRERINQLVSLIPAWPFLIYKALDQLMFARKYGESHAFAKRAIGPLKEALAGVPPLVLSQGLPECLIDQVKRLQSDVLIDFTGGELPEFLLGIAPAGVWRIEFGDEMPDKGCYAFFKEMAEQKTITQINLTVLSDRPDKRQFIGRSFSKTHPYSLFLGKNEACWKAAMLLTRSLRALQRHGPACLAGLDITPQKDHSWQQPQPPGLLSILRFLSDNTQRWFLGKYHKSFHKYQYVIGIKKRHPDFRQNGIADFRILKPPPLEFWADPFLISHQGKHYLFFENFHFWDHKGVISYLELSPGQKYLVPELALECPYHLSYPFVFKHDEEVYMIPESAQNKTVDLYKATDFPRGWVLEKTLFSDVDAHDATLFEANGKFWLFMNIAVSGGSAHDELFLFFADSLLGEWTAHPKNPIVSDVSRARPAGRLFYHRGQLIRPSQDCSVRYGYAVNFNRVDILTEQDYQETLVHKYVPDEAQGHLGVHTYDANEMYEVIDIGTYLRFAKRVYKIKSNCPDPPLRKVSALM